MKEGAGIKTLVVFGVWLKRIKKRGVGKKVEAGNFLAEGMHNVLIGFLRSIKN